VKKSKVLLFDEDATEDRINKRIRIEEENGWEVKEHRVAVAKSNSFSRVVITFLMQQEV
jgi:hypothetical protein